MYNKFSKGVASVLGAALVLGSVIMSVVPAQAKTVNGTTATYLAQDLVRISEVIGEPTVADAADGALTITYPTQYNQVFFEIPAEIMAAGWETAKITLGDGDGSIVLKLNDRGCADGGIRGVATSYSDSVDRSQSPIDQWGGEPVGTVDDYDSLTLIDLMNGLDGENTVTFKSITFTTTNPIQDDGAAAGGDETPAAGGDDASAGTTTTTPDTSSKTGESTTLLWVVCALGGLLLMSAAGMFVFEQKKRR